MKRRIVITSAITIVLCLCIITGSTFALFTSTDKVNIAVTAGAVNVTAEITNMKTYTDFEPPYTDSTYEDTNGSDGYYFENGGTAVLSSNKRKLTLTNITPGDAVDLTITVKNYSNVDIMYLVRCTVTTSAETQELEVLVNSTDAFQNGNDYRSHWFEWSATGADTREVPVTVWLPAAVGNDYQGETADITITVYAIQGNVVEADANAQFGLN